MSSGGSRSRKRKVEPTAPAEPEAGATVPALEDEVEDLVSQQDRERVTKKAKLDGDKPSKESKSQDVSAAVSGSADLDPSLAEFREQASTELKQLLAKAVAERELALKEYLLLRIGGSLGCFDPSDPAIVKLAEDYHAQHPINLEGKTRKDGSLPESDDSMAASTRTDLFRPSLFTAAGITLPPSLVPSRPVISAATTSSAAPKSSAASGGVAKVKSPKGAAAKRGPGRPPKTKDEMMPDMPTHFNTIQTTAASLSGASAPKIKSTVAKRSTMAGSKLAAKAAASMSPQASSYTSPAFAALDPSQQASPLSMPMMTSDTTLQGWMTYVPFLSKSASIAASKRKPTFPWHDAELFAPCTSVFDVPTPMGTTNVIKAPQLPAPATSSSAMNVDADGESLSLAVAPAVVPPAPTLTPEQLSELAKTWKERSKQDAEWLEKISLLQKEGKLSSKRMEPIAEPPRDKTHWDYLLKEMAFTAEDWKRERLWHLEQSKKFAKAAEKFHIEKARTAVRLQREREKAIRDKARWIARQVNGFWHDIEQLIVFKHRSSLDKHKKIAMDKNLDFFVKQTEQYSASLAVDLQGSTNAANAAPSAPPSSSATPGPSEAEKKPDSEVASTAAASTADSAMQVDDGKDLELADDEDFEVAEEDDDEGTIDAVEAAEADEETAQHVRDAGHADEAAMLAAESEMPIDEIMARYGTADDDDDEEGATMDVDDEERPARKSSRRTGEEDGSGSDDDENSSDVSDDDEVDEEERAKFGADFFARVAARDPEATEQQHQSDKERLQAAADEAQTIQPTGFTLATSSVKTAVPFLLQGTLREYQHIGLDWMVTMYEKRLNGILADEMGLGKTIMTISLLAHLACTGHWGPHLIVVPTSVLLNWEMELKRWCPQLKVLTYFGTPRQRKQKRTGWTKPNAFHVCLTSYKLVLQDAQAFKRMKWFYLILDEAHNIKNYKSQSWQTLLNFRTRRRLLLTGTPLQNNLMELWALMHFLMPHIFQSHKEFKDWFSNPVNSMIEGTTNYSEDLIRRLHSILRPFMLRRLKKDVEKQLPGKFEHIVMCKLSKRQRLLYDEYMATGAVQSTLKGGNYLGVANVLMQLRKVCNHPDLFEGRPIVSPFNPTPLEFDAPSSVLHIASSSDPFTSTSLLIGGAGEPGRTDSEYEEANLASEDQLTVQQLSTVKPRSLVAEVIALKQSSARVSQLPPLGMFYSLKTYSPHNDTVTPVHISKTSNATPTFLAHLATTSSETGTGSTKKAQAHHALPQNIFPMNPVTSELTMSAAAKSRMTLLAGMNAGQVEKRISEAQHRLSHIAYVNELRSTSRPLVMSEETIALLKEDIDVLQEQALSIRNNPSRFLDYSSQANALVIAPEDRLVEMRSVIENFVCYIPKARAPPVSLRTAHISSPSEDASEKAAVEQVRTTIAPKLDLFHSAHIRTQTYFPDKRLIQFDCGKLQMLAVMLRQLKRDGHRCLIFTQMTRMLDVLEAFINLHGYTYLRLDGATKVEQRQKMMERFNHDRRVFLFILSTRSGGLGINLVGADTVIFYDTDWNPAMDAQAQDRCHRIGQTREVHIYRLISERTIEENILKKAKQKRQLDNIIKEGNFTTDFFKKVDIREMVKDGVTDDTTDPSPTEPAISAATGSSSDAILIPGTAGAQESTANNGDDLLANPEMEDALLQAEDAADVEAFKAVRKEIDIERKLDDAEGGEDEEAEWEADLRPVHKFGMRYVELVNPHLDKNALANAHQQIAEETETWKDEALKRLRMGSKLWHGDEAPPADDDEEGDDDDEDQDDDEEAAAPRFSRRSTRRSKAQRSEEDDDDEEQEEADEEDGEEQEEDEEEADEEDGEEEDDGEEGDEDQQDEDQDDDAEDQGASDGAQMDEDDQDDPEGGDDDAGGDDDDNDDEEEEAPAPKRGVRSTTPSRRRHREPKTLKLDSARAAPTSSPSLLPEDFPLFYEVSDMHSELAMRYPGSSMYDIPFGLEDLDQQEVYLPPSSHIPQLLDMLVDPSGDVMMTVDDEYSEDAEDYGSATECDASPSRLARKDFLGDGWQFYDGSVRTFASNQLSADTGLRASDLLVNELDDVSRHHLYLKHISEVSMYKERAEMEKNKLISATASSTLYSNLMLARSFNDPSSTPSTLHLDILKQLDPLCVATWTKDEDACIIDTMREYWVPGADDSSPLPWAMIFDALAPLAPPFTTRTPYQVVARWYDHLLAKQASSKVRLAFDPGHGDFRVSQALGDRLLQLLPPSHLVLPNEYTPLNYVTPGVQRITSRIDAAMEDVQATVATFGFAMERIPTRQLADAIVSHRAAEAHLPDFQTCYPKIDPTEPVATADELKVFNFAQSVDPSLVFASAMKMKSPIGNDSQKSQFLVRVDSKPGITLPSYHPPSLVQAAYSNQHHNFPGPLSPPMMPSKVSGPGGPQAAAVNSPRNYPGQSGSAQQRPPAPSLTQVSTVQGQRGGVGTPASPLPSFQPQPPPMADVVHPTDPVWNTMTGQSRVPAHSQHQQLYHPVVVAATGAPAGAMASPVPRSFSSTTPPPQAISPPPTSVPVAANTAPIASAHAKASAAPVKGTMIRTQAGSNVKLSGAKQVAAKASAASNVSSPAIAKQAGYAQQGLVQQGQGHPQQGHAQQGQYHQNQGMYAQSQMQGQQPTHPSSSYGTYPPQGQQQQAHMMTNASQMHQGPAVKHVAARNPQVASQAHASGNQSAQQPPAMHYSQHGQHAQQNAQHGQAHQSQQQLHQQQQQQQTMRQMPGAVPSGAQGAPPAQPKYASNAQLGGGPVKRPVVVPAVDSSQLAAAAHQQSQWNAASHQPQATPQGNSSTTNYNAQHMQQQQYGVQQQQQGQQGQQQANAQGYYQQSQHQQQAPSQMQFQNQQQQQHLQQQQQVQHQQQQQQYGQQQQGQPQGQARAKITAVAKQTGYPPQAKASGMQQAAPGAYKQAGVPQNASMNTAGANAYGAPAAGHASGQHGVGQQQQQHHTQQTAPQQQMRVMPGAKATHSTAPMATSSQQYAPMHPQQHQVPSQQHSTQQGQQQQHASYPPQAQHAAPQAAPPKGTQVLTVQQLAEKIVRMDPNARATVQETISRGTSDPERFALLRNIYIGIEQRQRSVAHPPRQ